MLFSDMHQIIRVKILKTFHHLSVSFILSYQHASFVHVSDLDYIRCACNRMAGYVGIFRHYARPILLETCGLLHDFLLFLDLFIPVYR